jgi:acyl-CoA synthetase (NDP forming)
MSAGRSSSPAPTGSQASGTARGRRRLASAHDVPVVAVFMTGDEHPQVLHGAGVPAYPFPEQAIRTLGRAAWYG